MKFLFYIFLSVVLFSVSSCKQPSTVKKQENVRPKIPIFYTDLDGTFLQFGNFFTKENLNALKKYQQAGAKIGVATGRIPSQAMMFAKKMGTNLPTISANGAFISDVTGKILKTSSIPSDPDIDIICNMVQEYKCKKYYTAFLEKSSGKIIKQKMVCRNPPQGEEILKLRIKKCKHSEEFFRTLKKRYSSKFSIVQSDHGKNMGISIASVEATKGKAMKWVANYLKFNLKNTGFIGDSGNDISGVVTIKNAGGHCFVMKNGTKELKKACPNIISKTNVENGVGYLFSQLTKALSKD